MESKLKEYNAEIEVLRRKKESVIVAEYLERIKTANDNYQMGLITSEELMEQTRFVSGQYLDILKTQESI